VKKGFSEPRARVDQVFAVIEEEQEGLGAEVVRNGSLERAPGLVAQAEDGGDCLRDERRVGKGRELDEPDPIRKGLQDLGRDLEREAGFPGTTHAREREQPRRREQRLDPCDLTLPPDEGGELDREVVAEKPERL
jgi:hypothetical protein